MRPNPRIQRVLGALADIDPYLFEQSATYHAWANLRAQAIIREAEFFAQCCRETEILKADLIERVKNGSPFDVHAAAAEKRSKKDDEVFDRHLAQQAMDAWG